MRYPASEKLEIIQLVEQSALPVRRTLDKIGRQAGSAAMSAAETVARISAHTGSEAEPEIAEVCLVRERGDIVADAVTSYTTLYIDHAFG